MEEARFCDTCRVWLNCENQYRDHLINRMHRRKLKLLESCSTAAPPPPPPDADHFTIPPEDVAAMGKAAQPIQSASRKHRDIGGALAAS